MLTRDEILNAPILNGFDIKDLAIAIISEVVTLRELQEKGLPASMRENIERKIIEEKQHLLCEENFWNACKRNHTIPAYESYTSRYSFGRYVFDAELEIDLLRKELIKKQNELIHTMKMKPHLFDWEKVMAILQPAEYIRQKDSLNIGGNDWKTSEDESKWYREVLEYQSMGITTDILIEQGVIPNNLTLMKSMLLNEHFLEQTTIDQLPPDPPLDRTDVYFIGIPRSGKSCVIGGLLTVGDKYALLEYQPHFSENKNGMRVDLCKNYRNSLIEAITSFNPPQSTMANTLAIMKLDIRHANSTKRNPITLFEIGGEAFKQLGTADDPDNAWINSGAAQCLNNKNRKFLFFIIDYAIEAAAALTEWTPSKQKILLNDILFTLRNDGPDIKNSAKGSTMSKVSNVAILLTKCDLMGTDNRERRREMALNYVNDNFLEFKEQLKEDSRKYNFNNGNGAKLFTFSLGHYYIGNSFLFDETDSLNIIEVLKGNTRVSGGVRWF